MPSAWRQRRRDPCAGLVYTSARCAEGPPPQQDVAGGTILSAQLTPQGATAYRAVIVIAAAACTVALTGGLLRAPRLTVAAAGLLIVLLLAGLAVRHRRRLGRLRLADIVGCCALLLPLAALVGPVAALPGSPRVFAFRIMLAIIAVLGATTLAVARPRGAWTPGWPLLLLVGWVGWLAVTLAWAPYKAVGVRYLAVVATMLALTIATAWAGSSRQRLRALCVVLAAGYGLVVLIPVLELVGGVHLSTSALFGTRNSVDVTSFFHNQNHLGTFLAMAWPFLLASFTLTRRPLWLVASLTGMALGLLALYHTGARSSLLAYGIGTLALVPFVWRGGSRTTRRLMVAVAVVVVAAFAVVSFNRSQDPLLSSLNLSRIYTEAAQGIGSGGVRLSLHEQGLALLPRSYLLGVGPGNANYLVTAEGDHPYGVALHDWWLELLANGGLPGLALFLAAYAMLAVRMVRVERRTRDPFVRYLSMCTFAALLGYLVGAFGPGTVVGFVPMWILLGLAMAVDQRRCAEALPEALPEGANATTRPETGEKGAIPA